MVNKFTLGLPPLRGSRGEGEAGAPSTPPTGPRPSASRSCVSWVSTTGLARCVLWAMYAEVCLSSHMSSGSCGAKLARVHGDPFTPSLESEPTVKGWA